MAEEMTPVTPEEQTQAPAEGETNPEEQAIAQVIQIIATLSPESQRQLMGFLNQEFSAVVSEEQEEMKQSPEEQQRKADVMSEAF